MKKNPLFPILVAGVFLFACTGQPAKQKTEEKTVTEQKAKTGDSINLKDSLKIEEGLGKVIERKYEGILPAADCPGIKYNLTLCSQENSGNGVFSLKMTYLEAENGKDVTFSSTGKQLTLRGSAMNPDDTVYELVPSNGSDPSYFLVQDDSLTLLNSQQEKAESKLNYTIKLVK